MKLTPWYLVALAPLAVAGWSGALMGHVAVLAVTIGIFVGTLSLGKTTAADPATRAVATQLVRLDSSVEEGQASTGRTSATESVAASTTHAPLVLCPNEAA